MSLQEEVEKLIKHHFAHILEEGERIIINTTEVCGCKGQGKCHVCKNGYIFDAATLVGT